MKTFELSLWGLRILQMTHSSVPLQANFFLAFYQFAPLLSISHDSLYYQWGQMDFQVTGIKC